MTYFFITFRYVYLNEQHFLTPSYTIDKSIAGAGVSLEYQCGNNSSDGRHLAKIIHDSAVIPQDIILEALGLYGAHLKTDATALQFAKDSTSDQSLTMTAGVIDFPVPTP